MISLTNIFSFALPKLYEAKALAIELAKRTPIFKDWVITEELKKEETDKKGFISGFYQAFREYLIQGLSHEDFADLYSQTIAYGLFAARTRMETFNRKLAYDGIPPTIGILRDLFHFISLGNLPKQMEWIIDDLAEVLAVTDVQAILHGYFHEGKGKDPIVHFYETFLTEYDPKTRERRGVSIPRSRWSPLLFDPSIKFSRVIRQKRRFGRWPGNCSGPGSRDPHFFG